MPSQPNRAAVGGGLTLALLGMWLGHTAEYARVWGTRGLSTELVGSVHVYMLPLAAVIALSGVLVGARLWTTWVGLGRRLDAARARLRAALRGRRTALSSTTAAALPSLSSRLLVAWPALTLLQIALYVLQENIETAAAGLPAPGLGAITGVHALAPLVHAGVALVLLTLVAAVLRVIRRRERAVQAVEAVIRLLARAHRRVHPDLPPPSHDAGTPLQLFGLGLRQRPPPGLITA